MIFRSGIPGWTPRTSLSKIDEVVPWEDFRGCLDAVCRRSDKARKSRAGRKPWDAVVMFKTIILSALYNLSDDQVEHQIRDRLSFTVFGVGSGGPGDAKTVWLYREQLASGRDLIRDVRWPPSGWAARSSMPRSWRCPNSATPRLARRRNAQDKPAKRRQKDVDRWTKNTAGAITLQEPSTWTVGTSWCGDQVSKVLDDILDGDNTALGVWADSAYRSAEIEAALKKKGLRSRIHRKARRNKPLSEREKQGNKTRSSVRVRVEHVFGAQSNDMGGTLLRSVGLARAKARIGLKNLAYNMRRLVQLNRLAAAV